MIKPSSKIFIQKAPKKKDAARINFAEDIEKDGVFYAKPKVIPACPMGVEIPDWLDGAPIEKNHDDSFTITTSRGKSTGNMMDSYWVRYGTKEDGTPDANILTKSEPSFDDYYLCTEDGQNICSLRDFDEGFEYELDSNFRLTPEEYAVQLAEENGIQQANKNIQSSRVQRAGEIISSSGDDDLSNDGFVNDQLS